MFGQHCSALLLLLLVVCFTFYVILKSIGPSLISEKCQVTLHTFLLSLSDDRDVDLKNIRILNLIQKLGSKARSGQQRLKLSHFLSLFLSTPFPGTIFNCLQIMIAMMRMISSCCPSILYFTTYVLIEWQTEKWQDIILKGGGVQLRSLPPVRR